MERAPLFTDENPCFVYRALQYCPDIRMRPQRTINRHMFILTYNLQEDYRTGYLGPILTDRT